MLTKLGSAWEWLNEKDTSHGRAWRTFYQTFLAVFLISIFGFIDGLNNWASGGEGPQLDTLVRGLTSAFAAGCAAVLSWAQNKYEWLRQARKEK